MRVKVQRANDSTQCFLTHHFSPTLFRGKLTSTRSLYTPGSQSVFYNLKTVSLRNSFMLLYVFSLEVCVLYSLIGLSLEVCVLYINLLQIRHVSLIYRSR